MNKLIRVSLFLFLLLGLLLIALTFTPQAHVFSDELGDPRPVDIVLIGEDLSKLQYMDNDQPTSSMNTDIVSWSNLVFQSFRDGNWEIYFANGNGLGQRRLTQTAASDIQPHLNRGSTKVVFASNRTSSYEIYSMNVDGTNLMQLTTNGTDDVKPIWSPTGDKILFQAYRDGQSEIYVMNANGSNQIRLTNNYIYDGRANWSPDGRKITFVSQQDNQYRIWMMNADGTEKRQLSNQPYSANPIWSPDGQKIAYDADQDGDGRQELWWMNANGTNQQMLYDWGGSYTDIWAGSWSPDGSHIAFTQIEFVYYENNWYWTSAQMKAISPSTMETTYLGNQNTNWYPALQTIDNQIPISKMLPLPTFSRQTALVTWLGYDSGESGLKSFDLQYRESNSDTWQEWLQAYNDTTAKFSNNPGQSYHFRVRAIDNAYNTEPWPPKNEESHTTLYSWGIRGEIKDNTDTPIMGASTIISPAAFYDTVSNQEGEFISLTAVETNPYQVTWEKEVYGPLPMTNFDSQVDPTMEVILPPIDDVVINGGFEESTTNLNNWIVSGNLTASLTAENQHSGTQSIKMGQDCPQPCFGAEEYIEGAPEFVVDSNGIVHMIYGSVSYRYRTTNGVWSDPVLIHSSYFTYGPQPRLAIDTKDTLHAVWDDSDGIHYSQKPVSGNWSSPTVLDQGYVYAIDADSKGGVHIIYQAQDPNMANWPLYYRERTPSGNWLSPYVIDLDGRDGSDIAIGQDDTVHFIWQANNSIFHRSRTNDGNWSITTKLHNEGSYYPQQIVADLNGGLHAYWSWGFSGYYAYRPPNADWSPPIMLENSWGDGAMTTDWEGTVHLVSTHSEPPAGTYYRKKYVSGVWSDPIKIDDWAGTEPTILQDPFNVIHIARKDSDVPEFIRYQTRQVASVSKYSSISQQITIPEEAHQPHISFLYQAEGMVPDTNSALSIFVDSGGNQTQVFSINKGALWEHAWGSLAPWSGQTITLTLQLLQGENSGIRSLLLDEISVGSAYPDVWLQYGSLPTSITRGDKVVYQVQYGNRSSDLVADNVQLEMIFDEDFVYETASPAPLIDGSKLSWSVGSLPGNMTSETIIVTGTVSTGADYFTMLDNYVEIGTETSELETLNNSQHSRIPIAHMIYLPIISRSTP